VLLTTRKFVSLLALATLASVAVACGGSDKKDAAPAATTTTTNATDSTATTTPSDGSVPEGTDEKSPWNADAQQYRGKIGEKFSYKCPAGGERFPVWGVETYTDDSSVCNAAVQVGLISFAEGGDVEIEIGAAEDSYDDGVGNDVTSKRYASWGGSFTFPEAPPGSGTFEVSPESWARNATEYKGKDGKQVVIRCSANGDLGSVWGSGPFTADSSVCSAGVLAGVIKQADGGSVTIKIAPGEDSYKGSTANGVTSSDYGSYDNSFTIVKKDD
jgi:hypothetical protein